MKKSILTLALLGASFIATVAQTVWVGGEQMYPTKDIIDNAVNSHYCASLRRSSCGST